MIQMLLIVSDYGRPYLIIPWIVLQELDAMKGSRFKVSLLFQMRSSYALQSETELGLKCPCRIDKRRELIALNRQGTPKTQHTKQIKQYFFLLCCVCSGTHLF